MIDFATDNYAFYHVQLAKIIGIESAVYVNELININSKAIRKHKVDEDNYFTLDRKYITTRTTLTPAEQIAIESNLCKIELIKTKPNENKIFVDTEMYSSLVYGDNAISDKARKLFNKKNKEQKSKEKKDNIIKSLKAQINTDNEELNKAYYDWIDSVFAKKNILSNSSIKENQKLVNEYAKGNLDIALEVISISTRNGWRDMQYAINKHKQRLKISNINNFTPQKRVGYGIDNTTIF